MLKYSDIEQTSLTPDKMLNSLVYRTLFYVIIYASLNFQKTVRFLPTLYKYTHHNLTPNSGLLETHGLLDTDFVQHEIRYMKRVSTPCMLFLTPLSKQEFAMYGDVY